MCLIIFHKFTPVDTEVSKFRLWQCGCFYTIIIPRPIRKDLFLQKVPGLIRPKSISEKSF